MSLQDLYEIFSSKCWFFACSARDISDMIGELLFICLFRGRVTCCGFLGVCVILLVLWGEWNGRVFGGVEGDLSEVGSLFVFILLGGL